MNKELIGKLRAVGKDYDFHENALVYEAADCIEALEAELQEEARLNGMGSEREAKLMAELFASQAREVQLWEALSIAVVGGDYLKSERDQFDKLLAQPTDTTALASMIAKAGDVMRERCCNVLFSNPAATEIAIRALPGVTLEDLQK